MDSAVTSEMARMWAKEAGRLRNAARDMGVQIRLLEEKLAAAQTLGLYEPGPQGVVAESLEALANQEQEGDGESSLPDLILKALRQASTSLDPTQIKEVLLNSGVDEAKFGRNGAYLYSCVGRLMKRKLITRRGKKYSAIK